MQMRLKHRRVTVIWVLGLLALFSGALGASDCGDGGATTAGEVVYRALRGPCGEAIAPEVSLSGFSPPDYAFAGFEDIAALDAQVASFNLQAAGGRAYSPVLCAYADVAAEAGDHSPATNSYAFAGNNPQQSALSQSGSAGGDLSYSRGEPQAREAVFQAGKGFYDDSSVGLRLNPGSTGLAAEIRKLGQAHGVYSPYLVPDAADASVPDVHELMSQYLFEDYLAGHAAIEEVLAFGYSRGWPALERGNPTGGIERWSVHSGAMERGIETFNAVTNVKIQRAALLAQRAKKSEEHKAIDRLNDRLAGRVPFDGPTAVELRMWLHRLRMESIDLQRQQRSAPGHNEAPNKPHGLDDSQLFGPSAGEGGWGASGIANQLWLW